MLIQGAFRHVQESLTADRFLSFLADEAPGGCYFVAQPPPGIIMTAAIDWRVVVPDRAVLDGLAVALWNGYESLVRPLQNGHGIPQLLIQIKNVKGESDQFTIGKDVAEKEGLLHRMKESTSVLWSKNQESAVRQELERTEGSDYWLRIGAV